jgi:hypothetical protein
MEGGRVVTGPKLTAVSFVVMQRKAEECDTVDRWPVRTG